MRKNTRKHNWLYFMVTTMFSFIEQIFTIQYTLNFYLKFYNFKLKFRTFRNLNKNFFISIEFVNLILRIFVDIFQNFKDNFQISISFLTSNKIFLIQYTFYIYNWIFINFKYDLGICSEILGIQNNFPEFFEY